MKSWTTAPPFTPVLDVVVYEECGMKQFDCRRGVQHLLFTAAERLANSETESGTQTLPRSPWIHRHKVVEIRRPIGRNDPEQCFISKLLVAR
jgi:hypothetical protein